MANNDIGALRVTLGFDTSQFEHGSANARRVIQRDAAVIKTEVSGLRNALKGLAAVFLSSEAIGAARHALNYAASIKSVASEVGVTRRELQEYRYVASQTDLTQQEMDASLRRFTKTIGEAHAGTKGQATIFRDLGVAVQDVNGRVYTAGEVLPKLADALSRIKDPATRARLEVKLFGEQGQKLDAMLMQGSKGIEEMRKRATELGRVLGDDLVDNADRANQKLQDIKNTLNMQMARAIAENADAITSVADALANLTSRAIQLINEYPRLAPILTGMIVGGSIGGAPGALIGGVAGAYAGDSLARSQADSNMDLQFRRKALDAALRQMKSIQSGGEDAPPVLFRRTDNAIQIANTLEDARAEVHRQADLVRRAAAYQRAAGGIATPTIADGLLPVPNERSRKGPKDRTERLAQRFRDELSRMEDEELSLRGKFITDLRKRAASEHERAHNAKAAYDADVDSRVKQGELTDEQARQLKFQRERNYDLEKQSINWSRDDALLAEDTRVAQESLSREQDMLQIRAALTTTAKGRRAVQLAMLDNELESARLAAQEVIDRRYSSDIAKQIAQEKLDQLTQIRLEETRRINRETMGPLESYLDSIPSTADEINEAYENIAANGLKNMNDQLAEAASRTLRLKGFAGQLFNQMIADLIRLQMQQAMGGGGILGGLTRLVGGVFGLGGGRAEALGSAIGIDGLRDAARAEANFAGGGSMTVLGRQGIDRNVLSLNGLPIANISYGERLSIANDNSVSRQDALRLQVVKGDLFDVIVDQRAAGVAAPLADQASVRGSIGAQVAMAKSRSRRIP